MSDPNRKESSDSEKPNSSDTISRKGAIDYLTTKANRTGSYGYISAKEIHDYLSRMPSAQPEIIHCKDCRHGVDYYHEGDCYCSNPKWGLKYFGGSWEFYCADAERRTDESD